ncbi:serine hydrolase domain-containing protein [Nonomuraea sp. NPDC005983]|uniref:serine hydrolase domain-containing protein n=1 Tax=Nonomuraea sp. NPDC005983 TaxID=3155595 RepID=UPI0033A14B50
MASTPPTAGAYHPRQPQEPLRHPPRAIRDGVLREELHRPPGRAVEYTDRAPLILGFLAEHLTGTPMNRLATERIWQPLGMTDTRFGSHRSSNDGLSCSPTSSTTAATATR